VKLIPVLLLVGMFAASGWTQIYSPELVKKAEAGDVEAQCHLGICYLYGVGVAKDENQASMWYSRAADQGDKNAKEALKKLGTFEEKKVRVDSKAQNLFISAEAGALAPPREPHITIGTKIEEIERRFGKGEENEIAKKFGGGCNYIYKNFPWFYVVEFFDGKAAHIVMGKRGSPLTSEEIKDILKINTLGSGFKPYNGKETEGVEDRSDFYMEKSSDIMVAVDRDGSGVSIVTLGHRQRFLAKIGGR
jgi:hypothetical protein